MLGVLVKYTTLVSGALKSIQHLWQRVNKLNKMCAKGVNELYHTCDKGVNKVYHSCVPRELINYTKLVTRELIKYKSLYHINDLAVMSLVTWILHFKRFKIGWFETQQKIIKIIFLNFLKYIFKYDPFFFLKIIAFFEYS
jgi:hypothetical protein